MEENTISENSKNKSKSSSASYAGSIASITLLVNLYGLAVEAMIVGVLSSPVAALYLSYATAATAVCVSITYPSLS